MSKRERKIIARMKKKADERAKFGDTLKQFEKSYTSILRGVKR